ncbi:MAG: 4-hydroxy-3-methylbut-2-enyl diphosphate reductase [Agathobacter sp.]|nr:4-hydroxy-3-methylbut-2-enyl diphosphate reductase [Agathobacter sp.]
MKVTLAKSAGFCFGVKRAVNVVYREIEKNENPIYTYGPIIHNAEVVKDLESKGVRVINNSDELCALPAGTVVIRSHGISAAEYEAIEQAGFSIVDATCPFVLKIHKLVKEHSESGDTVIIIGNPEHPEVQGIRGWVRKNAPVYIVSNGNDIEHLPNLDKEKVCIVSQTTFNYNKFQELVEIIKQKGYDIVVLNTICNATEERQSEAQQIASVSEAMIVIGDKKSSNTQKLFEICKNECENTYYIQTSSDMDYSKLKSINNVGITAGASTPNNIIEEVSKNVRNEL